jgi:hypothetical protein
LLKSQSVLSAVVNRWRPSSNVVNTYFPVTNETDVRAEIENIPFFLHYFTAPVRFPNAKKKSERFFARARARECFLVSLRVNVKPCGMLRQWSIIRCKFVDGAFPNVASRWKQ